MKTLQRVTRDLQPGMSLMYLYYREGGPVTNMIDVTGNGAVTLDVDAEGGTVGVELRNPGAADLEALMTLARTRELSLDGLFSFS